MASTYSASCAFVIHCGMRTTMRPSTIRADTDLRRLDDRTPPPPSRATLDGFGWGAARVGAGRSRAVLPLVGRPQGIHGADPTEGGVTAPAGAQICVTESDGELVGVDEHDPVAEAPQLAARADLDPRPPRLASRSKVAPSSPRGRRRRPPWVTAMTSPSGARSWMRASASTPARGAVVGLPARRTPAFGLRLREASAAGPLPKLAGGRGWRVEVAGPVALDLGAGEARPLAGVPLAEPRSSTSGPTPSSPR